MKLLRILPFLAVTMLLVPSAIAADFGVRAGRLNELEEEFVGAELLIDLGAIHLNPNVEYFLAEDVTEGTANLDVTLDIIQAAQIRPYVGAGLGILYVDTDLGDNTDVVGNLIGGVAFDLEFLTPYAQVKYFRTLEDEDGDNDEIAFTVGLRF